MSKQRDTLIPGANFWIRALAHVIDSSIITAVTLPISLILIFRVYGLEKLMETQGKVFYPWWVDAIYYVVMLVAVVFLWKVMHATPGKKILGLKVVDARTGGPASTGRLALRSIGYLPASMPIIPIPTESGWGWWLIPVGLGFFWILWNKNNYGWHDMMSKVTVVKASELAELMEARRPKPQPPELPPSA